MSLQTPGGGINFCIQQVGANLGRSRLNKAVSISFDAQRPGLLVESQYWGLILRYQARRGGIPLKHWVIPEKHYMH